MILFYLSIHFFPCIVVRCNDPCKNYHVLDIKDKMRHVNFQPAIPELHSHLCDQHEISKGNKWNITKDVGHTVMS